MPKKLKELDWINEREEKKRAKGDHIRYIRLKSGLRYIAQLEKQQRLASDEARMNIEGLKESGNKAILILFK